MSWHDERPHDSIQVGRQGRIVIPASIREELEMKPGADLIYRVENGCLILETRRNVMRRLQARFSHLTPGVSLADELISDRRREAAAEGAPKDAPARATGA